MNSKRLNICLLLSVPYEPNMPVRPAVMEIYGKCLPGLGHKVTWIMPAKEGVNTVQNKGLDVSIHVIPRYTGSSLIVKIFARLLFLWREKRLVSKLMRGQKFDIIQARNNIFEGVLAIYLKRRYKIPFVFQYTILKEIYREYKTNKQLFYFGKFANYVTRYILRNADLVFPISKWMEKELIKEGIPESKMMPVPMGANPELFSRNKDGTEIREKYDLNSAEVILYVGIMDKLRRLDILIHAFSKVREKKDNVKLLMVGEGDDRTNLEELTSTLGIQEDVVFTGQVSYFDVPYFIAAADVCVSLVPPLSTYKVSSPTKIFEYMVMGKPVVANEEIPEQKEVIEESNGGILVKFDDESLANGIIELLDDPDRSKEMGRKGHEWVVKNRSYENMARQVEKKYFELLITKN